MWSSVLLLVPAVQSTPAPEAPAAQTTPTEESAPALTPLLHVGFNGLESWLVDKKDKALLTALQMLDDRLLELPNEIPDWSAPPGTMSLITRLFGGRSSLLVSRSSEPIEGMMMFPLAAELRLAGGTGESAKGLADDVAQFLQTTGAPIETPPEGSDWVLPAPIPIWLGGGEDAVHLRVGLEEGLAAPDHSALLPANATVASTGSLSYGGILEVAQELVGDTNPEFSETMVMLEAMGMADLELEWAAGSDADRGLLVLNMPGGAEMPQIQGQLFDVALSTRFVAAIPGDATWATIFASNISGVVDYYRDLFGAGLDLDAIVADATGLELQDDIIDPLGSQFAMYASDATGGGGMFSTVFVFELHDRGAFLSTWQKLEDFTNQAGKAATKGYVRFSRYEERGLDLAVLSFPGLPVPLELSMTTIDGYGVLGMAPHAVIAAVDHIQNGEASGLIHNPRFTEQLHQPVAVGAETLDGVLSVNWVNTPRILRDGYSAVSLASSALANAVRSPQGPAREPGMILPPFHELRADAKAMVTLSRIVGADFRTETRADRSYLVNAAGVTGYLVNSPLGLLVLGGMALGFAAPATLQALEEGEDQQIEAELFARMDAIQAAVEQYAIDHDGTYPTSLDQLGQPDANGFSYVLPSILVDPWGDPFLLLPPVEEGGAPIVDFQP